MSFTDARAAIETLFSGAFTETPIAWQDTAFVPPVEAPWVDFAITFLGAVQITMGPAGGQTWRTEGRVEVLLHSPQGIGIKGLSTLQDAVGDIFRGYSTATPGGAWLLFLGPTPTPARRAGGWYEGGVICRFYYDEVR
ncbi:MAG: hypothetical protein HQL37_01670 [Alphaproteobacteria bacterium]|nr:hypothetical protein [Alphaproteobacteria bacterium]